MTGNAKRSPVTYTGVPFSLLAPHSRDNTRTLELSPNTWLIIWFHICVDSILHHTAHTPGYHIGTPIPAMVQERKVGLIHN